LGLAAVPVIASGGQATPDAPPPAAAPALAPVAPWPLVLIYGLAGLGYIVTATYLPVLVRTALPDLDSAHVWAVFGLGAAPSCFLWHRLHERLGTRQALRLNLALQALGVALPVLAPSAAGYLLSAILVGGTFVGTVTIAMPAAQRAAVKAGASMMAIMTVVYSVGQIIGPVLAGSLQAQFHSFSGALLAAAGALLLAMIVSLRL
ncbi:MAG: YbfB/YjiJ family MFS transporter, partial [Janthinobacterium sp.]